MDVIGVFSSWVTALMKLSCCSLRRISRTRKPVFKIMPRMIGAKKITPRNSITLWRQLRMIQPTFSATASATRQMPSATANAIIFLRLVMRTVSGWIVPRREAAYAGRCCDWQQGYEEGQRVAGAQETRLRGINLVGVSRGDWLAHARRCLRGRFAQLRNLRGVHLLRQPELLHRPDHVPVRVDFIPSQSVPRRHRMRVMIVVPAFAPAEQRHPPAIRRMVARLKPPRAPRVRRRIH